MPDTATLPTTPTALTARIKQVFHDQGFPAATPQPGSEGRFLSGGTHVAEDPDQHGTVIVRYQPPFPNASYRMVAQQAVTGYLRVLQSAGLDVAMLCDDKGIPYLIAAQQ